MKCPVCGQEYSRPESVKACVAWHRIIDLSYARTQLSSPKFIRKVVTK